ncbi:MAG: response regulator transcription factor [Acidimicrobiaceae bacterium]|nr:response regulator transcription factor [Acidimicrobiaceae bacterium]
MANPIRADASSAVRVLLVEDHDILRQALSLAFEPLADIDLVAEAKLGGEGVAAARQHQPDVVLLDRRLPDGDAIDVIGQFHQASPDSRVLVMTGYSNDLIVARAIEAGAAGLALKEVKVDGLVSTIRRVAAGERVFPSNRAQGAR